MAGYDVNIFDRTIRITDKEMQLLPVIADILEANWFGDTSDYETSDVPLGAKQYGSEGIDLCDTRDIPSDNDPLRRSIGGILASLNGKGIIIIEPRHQSFIEYRDGDKGRPVTRSRFFIDCWGYHQAIRDLYNAAVEAKERKIQQRHDREERARHRREAREAREMARASEREERKGDSE